MLLLFAVALSASIAAEQYAIRGLLVASPHWPGAGLAAWYQQWGTFLFFPYPMTLMFLLFPDGRLPSRRFRPVVWFSAAFWVLSVVSAMLLQGPVLSGCCSQRLLPKNPLSLPGFGFLQAIGFLGVLVALPFAVAGLVVKGRRGGAEVRHQVRWLAYVIGLAAFAFAAAVIVGVVVGYGTTTAPSGTNALFNAAIFILALRVPVACGISILKYRLFDIDLVINKTVVYGLLAAFITAMYAAIVVGVGAAVRSGVSSGVLPMVATALIALAFQPVRERARRVANRLVYGK